MFRTFRSFYRPNNSSQRLRSKRKSAEHLSGRKLSGLAASDSSASEYSETESEEECVEEHFASTRAARQQLNPQRIVEKLRTTQKRPAEAGENSTDSESGVTTKKLKPDLEEEQEGLELIVESDDDENIHRTSLELIVESDDDEIQKTSLELIVESDDDEIQRTSGAEELTPAVGENSPDGATTKKLKPDLEEEQAGPGLIAEWLQESDDDDIQRASSGAEESKTFFQLELKQTIAAAEAYRAEVRAEMQRTKNAPEVVETAFPEGFSCENCMKLFSSESSLKIHQRYKTCLKDTDPSYLHNKGRQNPVLAPSGLSYANKGQPLLWLFLHDCLAKPEEWSHAIKWVNREEGIFQFSSEHKEKVARRWGEIKCNRCDMSYQKMARSLRNYSNDNVVLKKVRRKLQYQFLPQWANV